MTSKRISPESRWTENTFKLLALWGSRRRYGFVVELPSGTSSMVINSWDYMGLYGDYMEIIYRIVLRLYTLWSTYKK
jgi:hypothetical protein